MIEPIESVVKIDEVVQGCDDVKYFSWIQNDAKLVPTQAKWIKFQ